MTDEDLDIDDEDAEESEPDRSERAEAFGAGVTNAVLAIPKTIGVVLLSVVAGLTRPIPLIGSKLWHRMSIASIRQYYKATGGDRVGLEITPGGNLELTPVKWRSNHEVDDDEKPGWKAKGRDKTWKPTTLGNEGLRLGKTPVIPLDSDSWKSTSVLEARVAEAVDMGETRPLYRVDEAELTATIQPVQGGGQTAVADGGMAVADMEFDPRTSPIYEDTIIDLGSQEYDGQAVSWDKSKELMLERTTTEEMDNQEERGFLAGRSRKDMMRWMWKIFLVAGLVAIAGLVGKELVATIFGGGGGGGGGGIPLTLDLLWGL